MHFPDDAELAAMKAQGYVGASLEDSDGRPIGVLCCISRHRLHITEYTKNAIKIIAARVSAELERKNIQKEKTRLETRLRQAQRMEAIGTLAGGIAHDFNNILFPIIGYTEMLMGDMGNNSACKPGLDAIYAAALRARDLVKQILTFSRHETGQLKLMKVQPVIKEALKLIRSTIPKTIEIHQNIDDKCGPVKADPAQIHQIIMNLATNAFHAMEDTGGILKVELSQVRLTRDEIMIHGMDEGEYLCLAVSDTGTGMDEQTAERIFDPFFTTKEKGRGTGMGLSVVHGIVKRMKGTIQVYTEPGSGSLFNVYIPVARTIVSESAELPLAAIRGGTEHILLVDDEKDIVAMETRMLERLGYVVTSHTSSIRALEIFRANPGKFDLVITDMTMPGLTGDKLALQINEIQPDIPVLLCTGFTRNLPDSRSENSCINAVLSKPIVMRDLAAKIREILDGPGANQNNDDGR
jgi:signal transduction histidine kinase/CheY-like chemotaxis protein